MDTRNTVRSTKKGKKAIAAKDAGKGTKKKVVEKNVLNKVSQKSRLIKKKINHIKKYIKSK